MDAREGGTILRYIIDNYGSIDADKLIFIHAHEVSYHYSRMTIWDHISKLANSSYFWTHNFGSVVNFLTLPTRFESRNGGQWAYIDNITTWVNMADVVDYLFAGTSMAAYPRDYWEVCCCSTFFVDTNTLWQRPKSDYKRLLKNVNRLAVAGLCPTFNWSVCHEPDFEGRWRRNPERGDNYIIGIILEKTWGVTLANRSTFEWFRPGIAPSLS
jgi:hypothetical protein